jgi:hypothetical protein
MKFILKLLRWLGIISPAQEGVAEFVSSIEVDHSYPSERKVPRSTCNLKTKSGGQVNG